MYLNFEWPLRNLNAKNIFFHGDQREEIFLDIPSRYGNKGTIMKVAKIRRSIYGRNQSPRAWCNGSKSMICNSVVQVTLNTNDSRHYYFKNKYLQNILVLVMQ